MTQMRGSSDQNVPLIPAAGIRSNIDVADQHRISGWARGPHGDGDRIVAILFVNGREYRRTVADLYRRDLFAAGIGDGKYGFSFDLDGLQSCEEIKHIEIAYLVDRQYVWASSEIIQKLQLDHKVRDSITEGVGSARKVARYNLLINGYCPICCKYTSFVAKAPWLRGSLICQSCPNGSLPRERALALILDEIAPSWRTMMLHECSPGNRGISLKIRNEASRLIASHYYPDVALGSEVNGFRNEDIQKQTFADETFDLFISLDVFEHIPDPERAIKEIWRTLRPDGLMICTFPIRKNQALSLEYRSKYEKDGSITHIREPEYHGNPISNDGALVTVDYGYDIHKLISIWAPFDVRIARFSDETHGILGEYTEVVICKKRLKANAAADLF